MSKVLRHIYAELLRDFIVKKCLDTKGDLCTVHYDDLRRFVEKVFKGVEVSEPVLMGAWLKLLEDLKECIVERKKGKTVFLRHCLFAKYLMRYFTQPVE